SSGPHAQVTALPQLLVSTVLLGGIYALIAVGLTLIFGIMRVVNFAHGEFLMLGMYLAFWSFTLWGVDPYFILVVAVPLLFALALFAFMKWTHAGRVMRATAQDGEAATLMGINTDRVYRLAFAIGIACVGVAGVLVSPLYSVYPTAGLQFVLLAYVVVVLGG